MNCVHYFFILLNEFFLWKRLPPFLSTFIPLYIFPGHEWGCWKSSSPSNSVAIVAMETNSLEIRKIRGAKRAHFFVRSKHFEEGKKKEEKDFKQYVSTILKWRVLILDELRVWKWQVKGTWALNRSLYATASYIFRSLVQTPRSCMKLKSLPSTLPMRREERVGFLDVGGVASDTIIYVIIRTTTLVGDPWKWGEYGGTELRSFLLETFCCERYRDTPMTMETCVRIMGVTWYSCDWRLCD